MTSTNETMVEGLYRDALSATTSPDLAERLARALSPDWKSIGDYSGNEKTLSQFTMQLTGFGKVIPDLTWKIEELIEAGDRVIVRGRATGTPVAELFGVPPSGRRFEIMSVDVHTIANGKIVRTHHVEDWAGAIRQLRG
jgi:predicted ester cyclase